MFLKNYCQTDSNDGLLNKNCTYKWYLRIQRAKEIERIFCNRKIMKFDCSRSKIITSILLQQVQQKFFILIFYIICMKREKNFLSKLFLKRIIYHFYVQLADLRPHNFPRPEPVLSAKVAIREGAVSFYGAFLTCAERRRRLFFLIV